MHTSTHTHTDRVDEARHEIRIIAICDETQQHFCLQLNFAPQRRESCCGTRRGHIRLQKYAHESLHHGHVPLDHTEHERCARRFAHRIITVRYSCTRYALAEQRPHRIVITSICLHQRRSQHPRRYHTYAAPYTTTCTVAAAFAPSPSTSALRLW